MKKQQLLWLAIAILFVLNIGTLSFIFLHRQTGPPPGEPRAFDQLVIQTLQLNREQEQQFELLKREHHEAILQLDRAMKAPVEQYFGLLLNKDTTTAAQQQLEDAISNNYRQKLQITYRHFAQLKSICTPEQQQHFDRLIPQLMQVMQPPPPDHGPRGKEAYNH